jgi:hypothetical protein
MHELSAGSIVRRECVVGLPRSNCSIISVQILILQ